GLSVKNIQLTEWTEENLVLNHDFATGNLSGWSETYNVEWREEEDGRRLLVKQNGYALSDFIPVADSQRYKLKSQQGLPGFTLIAYDALRHPIGPVALDKTSRWGRAPFTLPKGAAWLRFLYETGHSHLPTWR